MLTKSYLNMKNVIKWEIIEKKRWKYLEFMKRNIKVKFFSIVQINKFKFSIC